MATPSPSPIALLLILAAGAIAPGACTTYVRIPAVCPQDRLCLDERADGGASGERRDDFIRRYRASAVEVTATRHVPGRGDEVTANMGVLIGVRGYVLTTYAAVYGADRLTVAPLGPGPDAGQRRSVPCLPITVSRDLDLALLVPRHDDTMPPGLPIRYGPVIRNDTVYWLGTGDGLWSGPVIETGIVAGYSRTLADAAIPAATASPGAPLLNVCGEIVGLTVGIVAGTGRARFVPIDDALRALSVTPADLR